MNKVYASGKQATHATQVTVILKMTVTLNTLQIKKQMDGLKYEQ